MKGQLAEVTKGRAHADFTRRASGFVRGSLALKLPGEAIARTRYLVLDCTKCEVSYYRSADKALLNQPEGSFRVVGELQTPGIGHAT